MAPIKLRGVLVIGLLFAGCIDLGACPSPAGGICDPRKANCPKDYYCAIAEVCTKTCVDAGDCWVRTSDGCRESGLPGQRLPDGGTFTQGSGTYCPETLSIICQDGYCQNPDCVDGGCDYDVYGPSPFKGNRSQGPSK